MITYFIKSGVCLALLLAFYHLVLEREKMHTFNRFFLLGSVLFSFLAPLYVIYEYVPVVAETFASTMVFEEGFVTEEIVVEEPFNYAPYIIGLYALVSLLLLIRFSKNLFSIILKIRKSRHLQLENATIVLVEDAISPHTFWNYIFINKDEYFSEKVENELFTHELTHVTQKHTLDILVIEFLQVLFWINPTFILLKKAVKLNHEFLADNKVISTYKNTTEYQYLLLNRATWNNEYYLASNLNYLLTKKRLQMMTKQSSRMVILLKKLAIVPLLVGFIFLFAERVTAQEKADPKVVAEYNKLAKKYNNQPDDKQFIKLKEVRRMEELYAKLNDNQKLNAEEYPNLPPPPPSPVIKNGKNINGGFVPPPPPPPQDSKYKDFHYKDGYFMFTDKNGKKVKKKYHELTEEQKKLIPPPPPINLKKKKLSNTLFQELKDNTKYAVWVDGKSIKNSELNNYKATDFANYVGSKVHKNARSKRFPQLHQYYLMTHPHFEKLIKKKKRAFKEYKQNSKQSFSEQKNEWFIEKGLVIEDNKNPKTGFVTVNGQTLYFVKGKNGRTYYNRWGQKVDKTGKIIDVRRTNSDEVIPNENITTIYKGDKIVVEFKRNNLPEEKRITKVNSPPKPISPLDFMKEQKDKNADYFYNGKKINYKKALDLLENKRPIQIKSQEVNGKKVINLTKKTQTNRVQQSNVVQVNAESLTKGKWQIEEGVTIESVQKVKPKTGWITINNSTHYYVEHPNGKVEYFDRWGNQVDKNGKNLSPEKVTPQENRPEGSSNTPKKGKKKTSSLDSIPSKTGWEQVGSNYYAYKVFNGKKYYFDKDSGKQVSVKHPKPEDYDVMMQRIKNSKKEFYVENKRVSKDEFKRIQKGKTKYYYTGFYTNGNTVFKFHASKSKSFIEKLVKTSMKKGFSVFSNKVQILNPNTRIPNNKEFTYYLDGKLIAKNDLNKIDVKTLKSIEVKESEKKMLITSK